MDTLTFAELDVLEIELLPPRTVLSVIDFPMMPKQCNPSWKCPSPPPSSGGGNICSFNGIQVVCIGSISL